MKTVYIALLILVMAACGQSGEKHADGTETAKVDYSGVDKYLGHWSAEDKSSEIITISKCNNFDSAQVCFVNDGKTEMAFPYNVKEDKFRFRQPDYWVEILHDKASNQLLWKVVHFDEIEGKVVRKYNFKEM